MGLEQLPRPPPGPLPAASDVHRQRVQNWQRCGHPVGGRRIGAHLAGEGDRLAESVGSIAGLRHDLRAHELVEVEAHLGKTPRRRARAAEDGGSALRWEALYASIRPRRRILEPGVEATGAPGQLYAAVRQPFPCSAARFWLASALPPLAEKPRPRTRNRKTHQPGPGANLKIQATRR